MTEKTLSISSIKQFKACRRAYQLRKIYGVYPLQKAEALETGSNYHDLLEEFQETQCLPELNSKEAAMVWAFSKYIYPKLPFFKAEVPFEKQLRFNNTIIGRYDGLADGAIIEHKTTSAASIDEYEVDLERDEQISLYMLTAGVNKAFYTVVKKPTIRQKQSETVEEFADRCFHWYDEDTNEKIRVFIVTRTDKELQEYKKQLIKMFAEVRAAERTGNFYRNTCNCNMWGRKCEYAPICMSYDPNTEYAGFERRDVNAHYENVR